MLLLPQLLLLLILLLILEQLLLPQLQSTGCAWLLWHWHHHRLPGFEVILQNWTVLQVIHGSGCTSRATCLWQRSGSGARAWPGLLLLLLLLLLQLRYAAGQHHERPGLLLLGWHGLREPCALWLLLLGHARNHRRADGDRWLP